MKADNRKASADTERMSGTAAVSPALPAASRRGGRLIALLVLAAAGLMAAPARAELPQYAPPVHEGVATCASGVCHGSATERIGSNVLQNEFVTWTRYDKHAGAYELLLNDDSIRIARKLGLPNAHEADICLDCHADNVPMEKRGVEFQISDGVGCEACHGGAENWLATHTASGATHEENLENGLYPTEDVAARADLCLSCHLGTADKFATHQIMGAGHPRLAFELSTFSALQPPHWSFDDDYARRKSAQDEFTTWTRGVLTAARQNLDLIQGPLMHDGGLFPEIALFDCHSCHHPMSDIRWAPTATTADLKPGVIRINDANFAILLPIAEAVDAELHGRMLKQIRALNVSVTRSRAVLESAAQALGGSLDELQQAIVGIGSDENARRKVLDGVLARAVRGDYRDYVAAEQATMAMDTLLITLGEWNANKPRMDAVFATVENDEAFRPARFTAAANDLRKGL